MNPSEAVALIAKLKAAYPRAEVSADTARVYCEMLADLDASAATAAVTRHIATSTYWPSIAEIRSQVAREACGDLPPAELAWGEVLEQVARAGRYRLPTFTNPATRAAVEAIGWQAICDSTEQGIDRAHFAKAYRAAQERRLTDTATRTLPGAQTARRGALARAGEVLAGLLPGRQP